MPSLSYFLVKPDEVWAFVSALNSASGVRDEADRPHAASLPELLSKHRPPVTWTVFEHAPTLLSLAHEVPADEVWGKNIASVRALAERLARKDGSADRATALAKQQPLLAQLEKASFGTDPLVLARAEAIDATAATLTSIDEDAQSVVALALRAMITAPSTSALNYARDTQALRSVVGKLPGDDKFLDAEAHIEVLDCGLDWGTVEPRTPDATPDLDGR